MKKKRLGSIVLMIAVAVAVNAGWILASGYFTVKNAGYTMETMEDVLEGKTYLQSREYQQLEFSQKVSFLQEYESLFLRNCNWEGKDLSYIENLPDGDNLQVKM